MNAAACQQAVGAVGNGVASSLQGVDCVANGMAQAAFGRLFGSEGALLPALTILLTLYVAFFAFSLITGRSSLGIGALTPRMMTLGLVLTFATSWVAYQSVVWNLAVGAPDQIAGVLTGVSGSATDTFAQKIDVVFGAVAQAAEAGSNGAPDGEAAASAFSPEGLMWLGAMMLLLGTVGVLVATRIALAVLIAVGPVFVVLALFGGTRGLFAGWVKGLVLLAVAPLFAVLGGSLMLELAVPVIGGLVTVPGEIDARAAMAFFIIGAVHIALMVMVMRTAGTMVAGWSVFGLARGERMDRPAAAPQIATNAPASVAPASTVTEQPSLAPQRRITLSGVSAPAAANDPSGGGSHASHSRTTVISTGERQSAATRSAATSRARGIGSRFRAAPIRTTEKLR
ncbi:TrbL/VirB6 family protein [Altererythrobacter sp. CAU 1778]